MDDSNGQRAWATLSQFLQEEGWQGIKVPGRQAFQLTFAMPNGQLVCFAEVWGAEEDFLFIVKAPLVAPAAAYPAVAEFLARINNGILIGNFELDLSDGEIRFKSGLAFKGATLTPALIRNASIGAVQTMDFYLPALTAVAQGGHSVREAIALVAGVAFPGVVE